MSQAEITVALWVGMAVFVVSALVVGRLLRFLPPSRSNRVVARLLQGCCCVGVLVCLTGVLLGAFR